MFKLNAKFDADVLLYLLSHFECDGHTVHMLTQLCLPPPLTSTVKLSLFTHAHSSPLSLAARLHQCRANCSYINNGWTFSGQTSNIYISVHLYVLKFILIHLLAKGWEAANLRGSELWSQLDLSSNVQSATM